jgi:hypothetical protein
MERKQPLPIRIRPLWAGFFKIIYDRATEIRTNGKE